MFTIDLLKGKAVPIRVDLKKVVLRAVPVLFPILAVTALAMVCHQERAIAQTKQDMLDQQLGQTEQYTQAVVEHTAINKQIKGMEKCLKDISKALSYRIQVSGLLVELVQPLPKSIFINEMKMDRSTHLEKIPQDDGGEVKRRLVVSRDLRLVVCGFEPGQSDHAVQKYIKSLQASKTLSHVFAEFKPSVREQGKVEDKDAIFYEIECVLREQR